MTKTLYEAAALTAAVAPDIAPAGVRESEQFMEAGDRDGLQTVVVTDSAGKEYDTTIAEGGDAVRLLSRRAVAAISMHKAKEPASLRFRLENVRYFKTIDKSASKGLAVMVTRHHDGEAAMLTDLTAAQCGTIGAAIGSVHRMNPQFAVDAKFPTYTAQQIHKQMGGWMRYLSKNNQIPKEITGSWREILSQPNLFDFQCRLVHGGFEDGDVLFRQEDVSAMLHWENLQVNDPARDLAWIYKYLDPERRNAVTAAYARIMDSRMDDMIMLRARMWVEMEQVRDYLDAIERADNVEIMNFKASLDQLAHRIIATRGAQPNASRHYEHPNTLTVGDLLNSPDGAPGARPVEHPGEASHAAEPLSPDLQTAGLSSPYTVNAADFARREGLASNGTGRGGQARATQRGADVTAETAAISMTRGTGAVQADDAGVANADPSEQVQHFALPELNTVGLNLDKLSHPDASPWAHEATGSVHAAPVGGTTGAHPATRGTTRQNRRPAARGAAPQRPASQNGTSPAEPGDETNAIETVASATFEPRHAAFRGESAETYVYARDVHADEVAEFSDTFQAPVHYGGQYASDDAPDDSSAGSDLQTVMLPAQPLYFEEDSDDDPAHVSLPGFHRSAGKTAAPPQPAASQSAPLQKAQSGTAASQTAPGSKSADPVPGQSESGNDEAASADFGAAGRATAHPGGAHRGAPDTDDLPVGNDNPTELLPRHGTVVADDADSNEPSGEFSV